jgi:WD40 repeat protein
MIQTADIDFVDTYRREKALAFSPDGRWMALAGSETVAVWDLSNADLPRIDIEAKGADYGKGADVAFSPSSQWLFVSGDPARAFRAPTFSQSVALGDEAVTAIAVSPNRKWLATAGKKIALWDLDATPPFAKPVRVLDPELAATNTLEILEKSVRTLAFSNDGRWFVSAAGTGRLWDLQQLDPNVAPIVLRLDYSQLSTEPDRDDFLRYAFTPDSRYLLALSAERTDDVLSSYGVIPLQSPDLLRFVDERVKRPFTRAEWAWLFPGEPFPSR